MSSKQTKQALAYQISNRQWIKTENLLQDPKTLKRSRTESSIRMKRSKKHKKNINKQSLGKFLTISTKKFKKLKKSDFQIIKALRSKAKISLINQADVISSIKSVKLKTSKMEILDIAARYRQLGEDVGKKGDIVGRKFGMENWLFLVVRFLGILKRRVKLRREKIKKAERSKKGFNVPEGLVIYEMGSNFRISHCSLSVKRRKSKSPMLEDFKQKLGKFQEQDKENKDFARRRSSYFLPTKPIAYTTRNLARRRSKLVQNISSIPKEKNVKRSSVLMQPSSKVIEEPERPTPFYKRVDSPSFRKTKLHFERKRFKGLMEKELEILNQVNLNKNREKFLKEKFEELNYFKTMKDRKKRRQRREKEMIHRNKGVVLKEIFGYTCRKKRNTSKFRTPKKKIVLKKPKRIRTFYDFDEKSEQDFADFRFMAEQQMKGLDELDLSLVTPRTFKNTERSIDKNQVISM
jgi:hypothetical protein